jgi:hypothetical protein
VLRPSAVLTGLFFFAAATAWAQGPPGVNIHKAAPTVAQRTFDPKRPPKDIPVMIPGEAGLTHYEYTTDIAVAGDTDVLGPGSVNVTIDTADINLSLPITVWLENNAPQVMVQHENGHVAISEYYYANIDVYARRAGQAVMGKTFSGTGKDKQSAEDNATNKAIQQIEKAILDQTRVRAVSGNDRYDQITNHGRNPGSQADAATQAENQDPEPSGGKGASAQPSSGPQL